MSDGLDISGGATGMAAALADVRRHAGLLGAAADDLLGIGRDIAAVAVAADLGEAALLCPDVVAEVEQRLTAATLSPAEGVLVVGSELGVLGSAAAWCAQTYERVDAEVAASLDHAVHVGGFAAGWAAPLALAPLVAALSAAVAAERATTSARTWPRTHSSSMPCCGRLPGSSKGPPCKEPERPASPGRSCCANSRAGVGFRVDMRRSWADSARSRGFQGG